MILNNILVFSHSHYVRIPKKYIPNLTPILILQIKFNKSTIIKLATILIKHKQPIDFTVKFSYKLEIIFFNPKMTETNETELMQQNL